MRKDSDTPEKARTSEARMLALWVLCIAAAVGVAVVWTALSCGCGGAAASAAAGAAPGEAAAKGASAVFRITGGCLLAAVLEELIFRGATYYLMKAGFAGRGAAQPALKAALIQAALFAVLHLTGALPEQWTVAVTVQAVAKVTAAFCFGLVMAALVEHTGHLWAPLAVHAAYNLLSLAPQELLCGQVTTYLTGVPADALIMGATALLFIYPAVRAAKALRCPEEKPVPAVPVGAPGEPFVR